MSDSNFNTPILDVPYFQQTHFSTCGPATLMMVMKYWENSFELSKSAEFKLWVKSNPIVFLGGTLQFGLAVTAMKYGYRAEIYQKSSFSDNRSNHLLFYDLWEKIASFSARHNKIPIYYGQDVLTVIYEALIRKIPPIVFLNLEPIIGENVLHWVIVTGMKEDNICINDPYVPKDSKPKTKKNFLIDLENFKKAIATDKCGTLHLPPCVILIYK